MCGIVGYLGNKNGVEVVADGLKKLEYRGYDSWGIAAKNQDKINIFKQTGKIGNFNPGKDFRLNGKICVGHTRWATHGGVTKANSHPHVSQNGRFVVVHNGIIENYQDLKKDLAKKGYKFISETDTEVIPNLIQEKFKTEGDLINSVRAALKALEGNYAVGILDREQNVLIGARKGSPLVLGIGKEECYIASDVPAFLSSTNKVVFLDEGQIVVLEKDELGRPVFKILDIENGKGIVPKIDELSWTCEEAEKCGHPHFMIKEMLEQPKVITKVVGTDQKELEDAVSMIRKAKNIYVVACGTALHAGIYGSYLFSHNNKINARPISAGEFPYFSHLVEKGDLIIAVSQSGETADVLEAVRNAKKKGANILALVNVVGCSLMRLADQSILTKAGPEICVLSTKAYVSQMVMFAMLSSTLLEKAKEGKKHLEKAKKDIESILSNSSRNEIKKLARKLSDAANIYSIGRGFNYATALEACLKIKEVSYIHAEGYAGGDLKHGPIALIEKKVPVLVFVSKDGSEKEIISNAMEVKSRGAYVVGISYENNPVFDAYLPVLDNGIYTPIAGIVYAQLLAYYIAVRKKLDPDKPRNLAKSVTVK